MSRIQTKIDGFRFSVMQTGSNASQIGCLCGILMLSYAVFDPGIHANDQTKVTEKESPSQGIKAKETDEKPQDRSLLEKLGDQILGGDADASQTATKSEDETTSKMDRAAKGMRTAGNHLDEGRTADETQKIQKQVIKDLEDIINQLENPPPNGGGGGGGGGGKGGSSGASGGSSRKGGGGSLRASQPQGGGRGASASKKRNDAQNSKEKNAGESSGSPTDSSLDPQASHKAAEEAERRRKKLDMDVWGHLPPHLREELLNTYGDRTLPKYDQMVRQFYEALSNQGDMKKK